MHPSHALHSHAMLACLATLLSLIPAPGHAQEIGEMLSGARIRVRTDVKPSEWIVGTFLNRDANSIRIRPQGLPNSASIAVQTITRLEISRGRHSNAGTGAALGAVAGAVGFLVLVVATDGCGGDSGGDSEGDWDIVSDELCYGSAPVLGGALGAGIGALIGMLWRSERWEAVSLSQLSVRGSPDRMGLRLALRFQL